jgi:hypothetical protein
MSLKRKSVPALDSFACTHLRTSSLHFMRQRFNPLAVAPRTQPTEPPGTETPTPSTPPLVRGRIVDAGRCQLGVILKFTPGSEPIQQFSGGVVSSGGGDVEIAFEDYVNTVPECIVAGGLPWHVLDTILPEDQVVAREKAAREHQEQSKQEHANREQQRPLLFTKHYGKPGAELITIPYGMMAVTLSAKYDNSDTMSDYLDRHASLSPDFVVLVVKKQAETERLARKALALCPELAALGWEWHKEKYSMGHGNYLESDGFELPDELKNLETKRGSGITHAHWEIEFSAPYRDQQTISLRPHKNFGVNPVEESSASTVSTSTDAKLIETTHTKKGHNIFVVQLVDRVDRETYERLNTLARELDGYYSSYRGNGAVPGFTFKRRDDAEKFMTLLPGAHGVTRPTLSPPEPQPISATVPTAAIANGGSPQGPTAEPATPTPSAPAESKIVHVQFAAPVQFAPIAALPPASWRSRLFRRHETVQ